MSNITPRLGALAVPIDSVSLYPGNPHQGDVGDIAEKLTKFGQLKPIVVQESTGHIVAGNSTWKAAKSLGWRDIAAVIAPLDDDTAQRYLIGDNRASAKGTDDLDALTAMLVEMAREGRLEGTGFDGDDVDDLLRSIEVDEPGTATGGRGRSKSTACVIDGEPGQRFQLKLQLPDGTSRGAGSIVLCEKDWLAHAAVQMQHPVDSFEELKEGPGDEGSDGADT